MFIKNNPCPKCGCTNNSVIQTGGFSNWDDWLRYKITCGNKDCKHTWKFSQEG